MKRQLGPICKALWGMFATGMLMMLVGLAPLACGKHPGPSIIERTTADGRVSVEIPAERTFDRGELPAGVEAQDVAAVITLKAGNLNAEVLDGPHPDVSDEKQAFEASIGDKPRTGGVRAPAKVYVLKDGRTIADKPAAAQIQGVQTVERSWAWLWWAVGAILTLVAVAWAVDKLIKPISLVARWFRR